MNSGILSDGFYNQYPQYKNEAILVDCVDSHILLKIQLLQQEGRVESITVACYCKSEEEHYRYVFKKYEINANIIVGKSLKDFILD